MHRVLCQLKAMVATTEVMPWKGNGALLFPLSTSKHKWLHWTICPRKPGSWRSKAVWRPPGISLGIRHVLWSDERLWEKAQKDCSSHSHPELRENTSSLIEDLLLLSLWCFLSIQCHTQIYCIIGFTPTKWKVSIESLEIRLLLFFFSCLFLLITISFYFYNTHI